MQIFMLVGFTVIQPEEEEVEDIKSPMKFFLSNANA